MLDTWDAIGGTGAGGPRAGDRVLVFDDHGGEPGLDAAEHLARLGARVELVTPERMVGISVGSMNSPAYLQAFAEHGVEVTVTRRLVDVRRAEPGSGARLVAVLASDYLPGAEVERLVDHVVVEHGTVPNDELYLDLVAASRNLGEVDHDALLAGRPQEVVSHGAGRFDLWRVGDAVTSRNIHAAIYDSLRLCQTV